MWFHSLWYTQACMQSNIYMSCFIYIDEYNIIQFYLFIILSIIQGSHYFKIRGRSDFSFRCWQKKSERQQGEVVRVQGEVKIFYTQACMKSNIYMSCFIYIDEYNIIQFYLFIIYWTIVDYHICAFIICAIQAWVYHKLWNH
jgi:hypothetical protein